MTMVFVALDLKTGVGALVNAGHAPVLHMDSLAVRSLSSVNTLLGDQADAHFVVRSFQMGLGDRLFLYTDGLTQNRGPDGKFLRPSQLRSLLKGHADPEETKRAILAKTGSIWGARTPEDDCTFLVLKWVRPWMSGEETKDVLGPWPSLRGAA